MLVRNGEVISRAHNLVESLHDATAHAELLCLRDAMQRLGGRLTDCTLYVTLEPCAHRSPRGPACADLVATSGVARVVVGCLDPDPRTSGAGMARIAAAGIRCTHRTSEACASSLAGYLMQQVHKRPQVTLKLALSLDGCIALANGESQWITGAEARAHCHAMRARHDAILVGGGTLRADRPRLDVRLPGLEDRSPERWVLTQGPAPEGWHALASAHDLSPLAPAQYLFVEGGAGAAAAFLATDHVDTLLIYRAPILIGGGRAGLADIGLASLAGAHGRWRLDGRRQLGSDTLEVYCRTRSRSS